MTPRLRPLAATRMAISPVGLGTWVMGGPDWANGWGAQSDRDSVATIHRAVELGVNWIDTAAVYGLGRSEELIGRALAALPEPDRPFVFTKCGLVWDPTDRAAPPRRMMAPASMRRQVEGSLRRLGVERLDLLQVHWPPEDGASPEEAWSAMVALRREGKVRAIGLSNHDVAQLEAAETIGHIDTLQPPFSAIRRSAAPEIAWSAAHGTAVIVYSPLQSGLLSGRFSAERMRALPSDDWRRRDPFFTTGLSANLVVAAELAAIARERGVPPAAAALGWALAWPGVIGAIAGARRPDQVDGWIAAAALSLTDAEVEQVASAIERAGAGEGPARPSDPS
jgi:aryl-alcohol dehydrogenase-like predicted oxidoreductase